MEDRKIMKTKTLFVCQNCGAQSARWVGRCSSCDSWNSFLEESAAAPMEKRGGVVFQDGPVLLTEVSAADQKRYTTQINELDRVLGGGVVPGSVILIGGDPGIGKSTLALQIGCALSQKGHKILYVSAEESVQQTRMRAQRLNPQAHQSFYIVNQVDLNKILEYIDQLRPELVIIDSIQVVYNAEMASSPGSVSQVRECASILTHWAKSKGLSLFLISHVTKDGTLAGPKVLEHIVDTVLYFEGERYSTYRVLRAIKNRFGSTNEIGIFEMSSHGLLEVLNPSQIFLSERPSDTPGSVVVPVMEGTRPFLVEIQGLISRSNFGMARQKAQGFDANRLALLAAVLEKRLGFHLQDKDIFVNVVGGVQVMDPAADLAVAIAMASAFRDKAVAFDTAVFGEVGLSSEVRSVSQAVMRVREAEKLGFKRCVLPQNNLKTDAAWKDVKIELLGVETVKQTLEKLA